MSGKNESAEYTGKELEAAIEDGSVRGDVWVNDRPSLNNLVGYLKDFPFVKVTVEDSAPVVLKGTIPEDLTRKQLIEWFAYTLDEIRSADEKELNESTGEFRFWWD